MWAMNSPMENWVGLGRVPFCLGSSLLEIFFGVAAVVPYFVSSGSPVEPNSVGQL